MVSKIENQWIEVLSKNEGAELTGLKLKSDGTEYLWQADPEFWGRHAPLLFPIIGKIKDETYTYEGSDYHLSQHGFARDCRFEVIEKDREQIIYEFNSNAETLTKYPFQFQLQVKYSIAGKDLNVAYSVKNTGQKTMYFSIGAHPGFNCPLLADEQMDDYYLEFETSETIETHLLEHGLISGQTLPFLKNEKIVPLSQELFRNDAIILEGLKSKTLSIKSRKTNRSVTVKFDGFPFMGIWSKPQGAPFVCIEPWYGIADSTNHRGELKAKNGILKIPEGEMFECCYTITIN